MKVKLFNTVIAALADGKPDSTSSKNDLLWQFTEL